MKKYSGNQHGVILIEAMVGILIFAIGILALMGLQTAAIGSTAEAKYRSDAAFFANQIVGEMWVVGKNEIASFDTAGAANAEVSRWRADIARALPAATGLNLPTIRVVPSAGGLGFDVTVSVFWKKPDATDRRQLVSITRVDFNE